MKLSGTGKATTVEEVVLGEALGMAKGGILNSYQDMLDIASAIANRAESLGVPLSDVVSVSSEFNAYGKSLPSGASKNIDLARQAINEVLTKGPTHSGTFYATPAASKNLPSGLSPVKSSSGHVFYSDPLNRSINTAQGFVAPSKASASNAAPAPNFNDMPLDSYMPDVGQINPIYTIDKGASKLSVQRNAGKNIGNTLYGFQRAMQMYEPNTKGKAPGVNDAIAKSGTSRERDTKGSQHFSGKALDIDIKNMSDAQKQALVSSLQASGFTSFGLGSNILHADRREGRSMWTYGGLKSFAGIPTATWAETLTAGKLPQDAINTVNKMGNAGIPVPTPRPGPVSVSGKAAGSINTASRTASLNVPPASVPRNDPRATIPVGSIQRMASPAKTNPAEIQRMRDNLRNQMAFRSPNPSNMNVSGYGFSTPGKPSATGMAMGGGLQQAQSGYAAPAPQARSGVIGGRGNINPPSVVAAPANNLSNFDQFGNFTGNRQSSKAPTSDFRSTLAERAAVTQAAPQAQRGPAVSTWQGMASAAPIQAPQQRLSEAARPMAPASTPANMGAAGYGLTMPSAPVAPSRSISVPQNLPSRMGTGIPMANDRAMFGPAPAAVRSTASMPGPTVAAAGRLAGMNQGLYNLPSSRMTGIVSSPNRAPIGNLPSPQRQAPAIAPAPQQRSPQITNEPQSQYSGRTPGDRARSAAFQPGGIFGYTSQTARGGGYGQRDGYSFGGPDKR